MLALPWLIALGSAPPPAKPEIEDAQPSRATTAESDREDAPPPDGVRVVAFADLAYIFNNNLPRNHVYRGASTSPRTNEFALNLAGVWLLRDATPDSPWWVQVGLHAGAAANAVYAAEPTPGGDDSQFAGVEVFKHVSLANAGVKFKSGTDVGGGVFASPVGIGSLFAKDNWLYTNAWELNWVPYYLMGARIGQDLPLGFRVEGWIVNGFQTIADVNSVPSYMVSLYWQRNDLTLAQHVFFGSEQQSAAPRGWLVHSDTQFTWNVEQVGMAGLFDVGREQSLVEPHPEQSLWMGGALSLRASLFQGDDMRIDLVARPETWWDRNGRTFGNDGFLVSATGGFALFAFDDAIDVHLEYRYDWSSDPRGYFFAGTATNPAARGLAGDQHNIVLALVGSFDMQLPRLVRR